MKFKKKGPLYLTVGLVPFVFVSILICILARRRILRQRLNNIRFSPRNPQVFVSPVVLYPNQIYPGHSESNLSQPPPSYETVKKSFIIPPQSSNDITTPALTRANGTSSFNNLPEIQERTTFRQLDAQENEKNQMENKV